MAEPQVPVQAAVVRDVEDANDPAEQGQARPQLPQVPEQLNDLEVIIWFNLFWILAPTFWNVVKTFSIPTHDNGFLSRPVFK